MSGNAPQNPGPDGGMCLEPCCTKYLQLFEDGPSLNRHHLSHGHTHAKVAGVTLLGGGFTGEVLHERRRALRELRCVEPACPLYGRPMPGGSTQAFYGHLESAAHQGTTVDENNPPPWRCDVAACWQYGRYFVTQAKWHMHEISHTHMRAVIDTVVRQTRGLPPLPPTTDQTRWERKHLKCAPLSLRETASLYLQYANWRPENHMNITTISHTPVGAAAWLAYERLAPGAATEGGRNV